jgi:hypothetical protein
VKEAADWVTTKDRGAGVEELIEQLIADDLRSVAPRLRRPAAPATARRA